MKLTNTGKIKGKRTTHIGDNEVKKRLSIVLGAMITRCYNPKHPEYNRYGGRGIKICDEWIKNGGLDNFYLWSINNGYKLDKLPSGYNKTTIDRINNDGNYEPSNCRWVDRSEQRKNMEDAFWVTYQGEKNTLMHFCKKLGLDYHAVYLRIKRRGWSVDKALSTPIKKNYQIEYNGKIYELKQLSREVGINHESLKYQYNTHKDI